MAFVSCYHNNSSRPRREERQSGGAVHEACSQHSSAGIVANMTASTVAQYLAVLPADRRAALSAVRKAINENQRSDPADCRQRKVHASPEALRSCSSRRTIDSKL